MDWVGWLAWVVALGIPAGGFVLLYLVASAYAAGEGGKMGTVKQSEYALLCVWCGLSQSWHRPDCVSAAGLALVLVPVKRT